MKFLAMALLVPGLLWSVAAMAADASEGKGRGSADDAGIRKVAEGALREFLPMVERTRAEYGFGADENLDSLRLEKPLPAAVLNLKKLTASNSPERVEEFLEPDFGWWFPVSLGGRWRAILSIVRNPETQQWIGESMGRRRIAAVLEKYRAKYPLPEHTLRVVLPPGPPETCLVVHGLPYSNLTWLSVGGDPGSQIAPPAPAKNVLLTLQVQLQASN